MTANDFSEFPQKKMLGNSTNPPPAGRSGPKAGMRIKPAFPTMGVPGPTQPRDRSLGVKRAKIHPHSEGL